MSKRAQTRASILTRALDTSSRLGLEGITFGALAQEVGMSKSGLYAHFDSKADLQSAIMDEAAARFVDVVVAPALKHPRGLPRLRALFELWLRWEQRELSGGCPFVNGAVELDDRPGPARDRLVGHLSDALGTIMRAAEIAVEEGHLAADLDLEQFAYEFWALLLAYHHFERLMRSEDARRRATSAFEALVERSQ